MTYNQAHAWTKTQNGSYITTDQRFSITANKHGIIGWNMEDHQTKQSWTFVDFDQCIKKINKIVQEEYSERSHHGRFDQ